jgi:hypothetical protein
LQTHPQLLIHIGYHKTGTTWLQTGIFQDEKTGFAAPWHSKQIRDHLVFPTQFEFSPQQTREAFLPGLQKAWERSIIPVLSDERLSGSPPSGGYDSALIAERLEKVFPEACILIVIREQQSAIYSIYQQYVRDGGSASLKSYLTPRNPAEIPQFRFSHLEYHHLIQHYFKLYGPSNVLVLPYEWLSKDSTKFVSKITEFCGYNGIEGFSYGNRYPSFNALTIALKCWANRFVVRNSLNPAARLHIKDHEKHFQTVDRFIPDRFSKHLEAKQRSFIARRVRNRYAYSNQVSEKLIKTELHKLGYTTLGE